MQVLHQEAQKRITVTLLRRSASLLLLPFSPGILNVGIGVGGLTGCKLLADAVNVVTDNIRLENSIAVSRAVGRMEPPLGGCLKASRDDSNVIAQPCNGDE